MAKAAATDLQPPTLGEGDAVPHFYVLTVDGQRVRYAGTWQHRNLVFVSVGVADRPQLARYVEELWARRSDFARIRHSARDFKRIGLAVCRNRLR